MYKTIVAVCLSIIFTASLVFAKNWTVRPDGSGSAPTIQAAVDSCALSGDVILIYSGTYNEENIIVDGKDIFVSGSGVPYLKAPSPGSGAGFILRNVTSGFNVFGIAFADFDAAIVIEDGSPTIWFSEIKGCGKGIEVSGASSAPELSYNFMDSCMTGCDVLSCSSTNIINHTIVNCNTGISVSGGVVSVDRNIVSGCGTGALCSGGSVLFDCNDFWYNSSDYSGCSPGATDIHVMPRFCLIAYPAEPYMLHIDSPCWASNNACGVNMGAFTMTHGCEGTALEETSWGAIKRMYR